MDMSTLMKRVFGTGFMLACDIVIAREDAKFGTPEVNVGLWPMMIALSSWTRRALIPCSAYGLLQRLAHPSDFGVPQLLHLVPMVIWQ